MPEPGYTSKNRPVRLVCEVCGVKKECVPCGNHRWCGQGRCPLCFPTILNLHQKPGGSMVKQQEAYKKIWDMEFWCETCSSSSSHKPPILKDTLTFKGGQAPVRLQGCRSFYMCRDGSILDQGEYASRQEQQQEQQQQQQQQQQPAQAAASPQATKPQRPQSAPTQKQQRRPASEQQQQQPRLKAQDQPPDKHKARPISKERIEVPAPKAAAAAGMGTATAKRPSDAGDQPKKRLKTTGAAAAEGRPKAPMQPQQQAAARVNAAALFDDSDDDDDDSEELNDKEVPKQQPAAKKAPAAQATTPAAAKASPGAASKAPTSSAAAAAKAAVPPAAKAPAASGQVPSPAAQPAVATKQKLANGDAGATAAAGSHRPAAANAATATAAARLLLKQGSRQMSGGMPNKQRSGSTTTGSFGAAAVPARAAGSAAAAAAGPGKAQAQQAKAPAPAAAAAVPQKQRVLEPSSSEDDSVDGGDGSRSDDSRRSGKLGAQLLQAKKAAVAASKAEGAAAEQQRQHQQQQGAKAKPPAQQQQQQQQPKAKVPAQQQQQQAEQGKGKAPAQQQQQQQAKVPAQQQQQQQAKVPSHQQQQQQGAAKAPVQQGQRQQGVPKQPLQQAVAQQQNRTAAPPAQPHAAKAAAHTAAIQQEGRQATSSKQVPAAAVVSAERKAPHKQQHAAAAKRGPAQPSHSEVSGEDDSSQHESSGLDDESADAEAGSSGRGDDGDRAGPAGAAGKQQQQQAVMLKQQGPQAQQQAAKPQQGVKQPAGKKAPSGNLAVKTSAAKAAANGPAAAIAAAGSVEGAAATPSAGKDVATPKASRRVTFRPMDLEVVMDQPAAAAAHEAWPAADPAAQHAAPAAAAPAPAAAPSLPRRPRSIISRRTSALWPVTCRVEAAGLTFRHEFSVQVKPAENRTDVQVPPVLERLRGDTMHCMFWNKETMLQCVRSEARDVDFEAVFDQTTPMTMQEVRFHEPTLPTVVKYMTQQRCYLRVWSDSGSVFFGPVLEGGQVADLDDRAPTQASTDQVQPRVLGLVMFKDSREAEPPEAYGRLTEDSMQGLNDEAPTPTTRAALAAASLRDESFLADASMDFFYDDEVFAAYQARARSLPLLDQQQLQQVVAAGMNYELLQSRPSRKKRRTLTAPSAELEAAAAEAAGPGTEEALGARGMSAEPAFGADDPMEQQQQQGGPDEDDDDDLLKGMDVETEPEASPDVEGGPQEMEVDHEDHQHHQPKQQEQQQEQEPDQDHLQQEQGRAQHPPPLTQQQQQPQPQEQQQQQGDGPLRGDDSRSPVARLLEGGQPVREIMAPPAQLIHRLKTRGMAGLVLYLEPISFQHKDAKTPALIKRARARGVVVHEPDGPPPPASSVDVLVVSNNHMDKCALEVPFSPVQITDYLVSGVLVVSEVFLKELVEMKEAKLKLPAEPGTPEYLLNQDVTWAFFQSGVALLLDVTLLLTSDYAQVLSLLQQLHDLKTLMPNHTQLLAFAQMPDLREAAAQHMQSPERWKEYLHHITGGSEQLCQVMDKHYISSKREPAGTHMLRNAHKVSYNYNKRAHTQADHLLPLRYTVVVTTDNPAALSEARRRDVAALLDNGDSAHKTVIGATMQQTKHLLSVISAQQRASQVR